MNTLRNFISIIIIGMICACSFENDARVSFQFSAEPADTTYSDTLRVQFSDGQRTRSVYVPGFLTLSNPFRTEDFYTENSGELRIKFWVFEETEDSIAFGKVALNLERDWSWSVRFYRGEMNPFYACFGCSGYRSFPIDTAYQITGADSIYVIWGGNSISNPVIY